MNSRDDLDTQPWYKQGWPWALIAIPFLTVIAGVITFIIANDTSDSLVQDDYYKKGLAINSNIDRVELAQKLAISGELSIDKEASLLTVKLTSKTKLPPQLLLNFSHPTLKQSDQSVQLSELTTGEYVGEMSNLAAAYWHVGIEDFDKSWLIKTRWLYPDESQITISNNP